MTDLKTILKEARNSRSFTLAQVAKDTGIPLTTINSWERGASYPRGTNRDIIAKYYDLPKESLDYAVFNQPGDARQFDIARLNQNLAMTDYETKPLMLHKLDWDDAGLIMQRDGDRDINQLVARLIRAAVK